MAALGVLFFLLTGRQPRLPYRDRFKENRAQEWRAFGGAWRLKDGMVINQSDESGAKIITGSPDWTDYQMTSDVQMLGHGGDVGILLRVNEAETGIDAYRGYYIGLRSGEDALIMGAANHDWLEGRPVSMRSKVRFGVWYRIHAVIVACDIAAEVTDLQTGLSTWGGLHDEDCVRAGQVGLRSMGTGARWKNIIVEEATERDLQLLRSHIATMGTPQYPSREDDYARMREQLSERPQTSSHDLPAVESSQTTSDQDGPLQPTNIKTLAASRFAGSIISIRGVVTLTDPLYVQDSTGGIAVQLLRPYALNVGDEVQLVGRAASNGLSSHFDATELRLLGDRTPLPPASISSTQAASGAFDGSLVEVSGELVHKAISADGIISLDLADIAQRFRVIVPQGLSGRLYARLQEGSDLRVRGICSADTQSAATGSSFTVLPRSVADIKVTAGPPWTSGKRLMYLIAMGISIIMLSAYLYLQAERWRMRAILQERERLAVDMHDTLAQSFAGVGFHLQSMRKDLRGQGTASPQLMRKLDVACDIAVHTHREASARIAALHPSADIDGDLLTLLQRSTDAMLNGGYLPMTLERTGEPRQLSMPVRDALFRVGREAIANVLRHSKATRMVLALSYRRSSVQLSISDNGIGFDILNTRKGFGLQSIEARGEEANASVEIRSGIGEGTTVAVTAPYGHRFSLYERLQFLRGIMERLREHQSSSRRTSP